MAAISFNCFLGMAFVERIKYPGLENRLQENVSKVHVKFGLRQKNARCRDAAAPTSRHPIGSLVGAGYGRDFPPSRPPPELHSVYHILIEHT